MARQRLAVRVPMRPKPTRRTVLPNRSSASFPSRVLHFPSFTNACISTARLASVSIMNKACSATDGELAVPATIAECSGGSMPERRRHRKPTPIRVTTCMSFDARSWAHQTGSRRVPHRGPEHCALSIASKSPAGNHIGEFNDLDVIPAPSAWDRTSLRHQYSDENFLLCLEPPFPTPDLLVAGSRSKGPAPVTSLLAGAYC